MKQDCWKNINNCRYADDTTLMAESEEELKSLLMKVKEESEKAALNLNIQKTKIMHPPLLGSAVYRRSVYLTLRRFDRHRRSGRQKKRHNIEDGKCCPVRQLLRPSHGLEAWEML